MSAGPAAVPPGRQGSREPAGTVPTGPEYATGSLADVLPSVAHALGAPVPDRDPVLSLPGMRRAVVVLVDGLGMSLLQDRAGHAPFLRTLLPDARTVPAGLPSTTATSMGSFGTGLPPGAHGLLGYEVLDAGTDRLLNELSWEDGPEPTRWQPNPTVFEHLADAGVATTRIGPAFFDGSGLTNAALRGGRFIPGKSLSDRVDATLDALRGSGPSLVYLYWGDLDLTGHEHGCRSGRWGEELEAVDAELARLARALPRGTGLVVTADHGMVDIPFDDRIDLASEPRLLAGVRHVGGEARFRYLYTQPDAAEGVLETWRDRLRGSALVLTREQARAAGWFGTLDPSVADRVGDVVVAMRGQVAVTNSLRERPKLLSLLGLHGSFTDAELYVPLLVTSR